MGAIIALSARAAAPSDKPHGIAGTWFGVYYGSPNLMEFEMTVEGASGSAEQDLTGTLNYFPSQTAKPITITRSSGEYSFAGEYKPDIHHVQIKANKWLKPPSAGYRRAPPPMVGIYDPDSDTLVGIFDAPENRNNERDHFFVCVRSSKEDELHEFIRRISGVAAKDAELEEKQQRQEEGRKDRQEQQATWQTFTSYRPQINEANSKVSSQERAAAQTQRLIATREREIARLDGLIAKGGRTVAGNQRNRDLKGKQLAELQQKLADQTAELGSAEKERDELLERIAQEHPEVKEHLAEMRSKQERLATRATPKKTREPPIDRQAKQREEAEEAGRMLKTVIAWASQLKSEFPDRELKPYAFTHDDAPNLFRDDYFRKHFGATYGEMSEDTLQLVRGAFTSRLDTNTALAPYRTFRELFIRGRQNSDLQIHLKAQPVLVSWLNAMQSRLNQLAVRPDVFDTIATIESAMKPFLHVYWPRERTTATQTVASARTRLADPVLTMKADELIASAKGYNGAVELSQWGGKWPDVFQFASADTRKELGARMTAKLNEMVEPLLAAEIRKIQGFGIGRPALEAGSEWYRHFTTQYAFAAHHPRYREGIQLLGEQRKRELPRAQADIIKAIASSSNAQQVDRLGSSFLDVPGDRSTGAGQAILAAAERKLGQLETAKLFSDYEMSLLKDGIVNVPSRPNEPTPEEIGLAVLREMSSVANGRVVDRSTARITSFLASLLNIYGLVTVHDLEKCDWRSANRHRVELHKDAQNLVRRLSENDAAGATAIRSGADSFWCIYKVKMKFAYENTPNVLGVNVNSREHQTLLDLMNSGGAEVLVDEFQLTKNGWRSPTARKRMLDKQAATARTAAEDARSRCTSCSGTGQSYGYAAGRMYSHQCWTCGGRGRR